MMEDIKRGPEKGPVSMETVDKRVWLDVDAGKAVKESMAHAEKPNARQVDIWLINERHNHTSVECKKFRNSNIWHREVLTILIT